MEPRDNRPIFTILDESDNSTIPLLLYVLYLETQIHLKTMRTLIEPKSHWSHGYTVGARKRGT